MASEDKHRVSVIGASGYSGEELIRLLSRHPSAQITCVTSRQYAGQPVGTVFPRFAELDLSFMAPDVAAVAAASDAVFLALPHGLASEYAAPLLDLGVRVIDISADFRVRDPAVYETYYGQPHPAPALLPDAVYGSPELYRDAVVSARLVACPGCYPTSILLPLCPLLAAGAIEADPIVVCSLSGVTGAGRKVDLPYVFPECNESVRPYGVSGHRHLSEIQQELSAAAGAGADVRINFLPHLVPVNRGIHTSIVAAPGAGVGIEQVDEVLTTAYADEPFVRLLGSGGLADTKHVTGTNMAEIGWVFDGQTGRLILSCAIDNLTKGASGQAVQCMNLMLGCDETAGLL